MTTDLLEQRLQNLAAAAPDAGRVTARVLAAAPRRRRPAWRRLSLSAVATAVLIVLVLYFVPAAGTAFAKVPFASELLQNAGLSAVGDRITSVNSQSSSSGYTLKLVGVYADATRTVLLVRSNPPSFPGFVAGPTQLTDQFGRGYQYHGGSADIRDGEETMEFDALAWPDAYTGARVTLHLSALEPLTLSGTMPQVRGDWTLRATVNVDEARSLESPAPATLGSAYFEFTAVAVTPATIVVDMRVRGLSVEDLNRRIADGGKGRPAFTIELIEPHGAITQGMGATSEESNGWVDVHLLVFREAGPGDYTIRVGYEGAGSFERVIKIP